MRSSILKTNNLTKTFKKTKALDQVNMTVEKGGIYGFIGQNGAGKTTLIQIVTGLLFPTAGTVELFGKTDPHARVKALRRVGAIVETPALYPTMTAEENLEVYRLQKNIKRKESVQEVLSLVGLEDTKRKKAKDFSLGMKQRLGLAIALLGDPEFLILDEPTNGLDPTGMIEFRELLRQLNKEKGVTILISSHLLSELHLLATTYGIIHKGKLLQEISAKDLEKELREYLYLQVDRPEKALSLLKEKLPEEDIHQGENGEIKIYHVIEKRNEISKLMTDHGIVLEEIMPKKDRLESYYTDLIGGYSRASTSKSRAI